MNNILISQLFFIITLFVSTFSHASSNAAQESKFSSEQLIKFSKQVETTLAAKGARVFIIGRVGRPHSELPEGISYTHTAFGVYSMLQTDDGETLPGYRIYNLYQRNEQPHLNDLVTDYPVEFFAGAHELKAGIIIPSAELQKRLLMTIGSDTYSDLHVPNYSSIANPYNLEYQNCTEHTLDVLNAAIYQTDDIDTIKIQTVQYFDAQPVKFSGFKLTLGSIFMQDVTLADHNTKRQVKTATFTTIGNYLEEYGLIQERFEISLAD